MMRRSSRLLAAYGSTPKDIRYSIHARKTLLNGVENLVKAVGVTLGPKGRNVILEVPYQAPKITKDGVTVAKHIEFDNNFEHMGAQLVRQVAGLTNDLAGDGTTTATILSGAIFSEGFKSAATGTNPMDLKRGIDLACKEVLISLAEQAKTVTSKSEIAQIATISANSDKEIGMLIADAMQQVGKDGVVTVEGGRSIHTELELVEGMSLPSGYVSPYFVTNTRTQKCEMDNCLVMCANRNLTEVGDILPALNVAQQMKKPLLVVANAIEGEALHTMLYNKMNNKLDGCAVIAPGIQEFRTNYLQDMAIFTGAQMISEETGLGIGGGEFTESMLGTARKVTITRDETMMLEGGGSAIALEERVNMLKDQISVEESDMERSHLVERLAKLSGGVAVIRCGGASEVEIGEKKDRVIDALNATRAAVAEGILAGGGTALLIASNRLHKLSKNRSLKPDIRTGVNIVKKAIRLPAKLIANNAGVEGAVVVGKVMAKGDHHFGYDAQNGEYKNMFEAGIIDPMKVTKSSVVNACSVAGLMITTEAAVVEKTNSTFSSSSSSSGGLLGMTSNGGIATDASNLPIPSAGEYERQQREMMYKDRVMKYKGGVEHGAHSMQMPRHPEVERKQMAAGNTLYRQKHLDHMGPPSDISGTPQAQNSPRGPVGWEINPSDMAALQGGHGLYMDPHKTSDTDLQRHREKLWDAKENYDKLK